MLICAQKGDGQAVQAIMEMYKPLLLKEAIQDNVFDEDIYQELCIVLLKCIQTFRIEIAECR